MRIVMLPERVLSRHRAGFEGRTPRTLAERFWEKVEKIPFTTCWIWTGPMTRDGYGKINVWTDTRRWVTVRAHRIAFFLERGRLPEPQGLHTCDMPLCVNPDHVIDGDNTENMRQMVARGRNQRIAAERIASKDPSSGRFTRVLT